MPWNPSGLLEDSTERWSLLAAMAWVTCKKQQGDLKEDDMEDDMEIWPLLPRKEHKDPQQHPLSSYPCSCLEKRASHHLPVGSYWLKATSFLAWVTKKHSPPSHAGALGADPDGATRRAPQDAPVSPSCSTLLEQKPNAPACLVKHSEEENTFESSAAPLSLPQAAKTSPLIPLKSGSGAAPHVNQVSPVLLYQPSFPFMQGALPRF